MNTETNKEWDDYQAKIKAEKEAKFKRLAAFAPLGVLLGFKFNDPGENDWAFDLGDKERGLFVRVDWRKERLEVSGRYPKDSLRSTLPYNEQEPRISLSMNKSNERLANDIKKRFLPMYEALLARCKATQARWDDYETKKKANEQRLIDAGALKYSHSEMLDLPSCNFGEIYGEATVSDKTVDLRLRALPVELAEKILNFIRGSI